MTPEELEEIVARCNRASPGPWTSMVEGRDHASGSSFIMTGPPNGRGNDIELSGATPGRPGLHRPRPAGRPPAGGGGQAARIVSRRESVVSQEFLSELLRATRLVVPDGDDQGDPGCHEHVAPRGEGSGGRSSRR